MEDGAAIRVAVVDDDPDIRALLKMSFEMDDRFELVGEAADGVQAVELITAVQPDLVILDLDMPRRGGLEAMQVIRDVRPSAKVVVFSARYERYDVDDLVDSRADLYIDKARPVPELLDEIARVGSDTTA